MIFTLIHIIFCSYNLDQDNVPTLMSFDLDSITQEDINMLSDNSFEYTHDISTRINDNDIIATNPIDSANNTSYIDRNSFLNNDNHISTNSRDSTFNTKIPTDYTIFHPNNHITTNTGYFTNSSDINTIDGYLSSNNGLVNNINAYNYNNCNINNVSTNVSSNVSYNHHSNGFANSHATFVITNGVATNCNNVINNGDNTRNYNNCVSNNHFSTNTPYFTNGTDFQTNHGDFLPRCNDVTNLNTFTYDNGNYNNYNNYNPNINVSNITSYFNNNNNVLTSHGDFYSNNSVKSNMNAFTHNDVYTYNHNANFSQKNFTTTKNTMIDNPIYGLNSGYNLTDSNIATNNNIESTNNAIPASNSEAFASDLNYNRIYQPQQNNLFQNTNLPSTNEYIRYLNPKANEVSSYLSENVYCYPRRSNNESVIPVLNIYGYNQYYDNFQHCNSNVCNLNNSISNISESQNINQLKNKQNSSNNIYNNILPTDIPVSNYAYRKNLNNNYQSNPQQVSLHTGQSTTVVPNSNNPGLYGSIQNPVISSSIQPSTSNYNYMGNLNPNNHDFNTTISPDSNISNTQTGYNRPKKSRPIPSNNNMQPNTAVPVELPNEIELLNINHLLKVYPYLDNSNLPEYDFSIPEEQRNNPKKYIDKIIEFFCNKNNVLPHYKFVLKKELTFLQLFCSECLSFLYFINEQKAFELNSFTNSEEKYKKYLSITKRIKRFFSNYKERFKESKAKLRECNGNRPYIKFKVINNPFYAKELIKFKNIIYSILKFFINDIEICSNYKILIDFLKKNIKRKHKHRGYYDVINSIYFIINKSAKNKIFMKKISKLNEKISHHMNEMKKTKRSNLVNVFIWMLDNASSLKIWYHENTNFGNFLSYSFLFDDSIFDGFSGFRNELINKKMLYYSQNKNGVRKTENYKYKISPMLFVKVYLWQLNNALLNNL